MMRIPGWAAAVFLAGAVSWAGWVTLTLARVDKQVAVLGLALGVQIDERATR